MIERYSNHSDSSVLARCLDTPAGELARSFQVDEGRLLHILPHLSTLLQMVVNGLVTHTAETMTMQGRRTRLVRLNGQCNVKHSFLYREQRVRFWLEWDRSTMNARDLAVKFTSHANYIASREWAREDARLPRLLCVVPDISQERRMQRVAQTRVMSSAGLVLWTTTDVLLSEHGPLSPICLQGMPQRNQGAHPGSSLRQSLSDILPSKKGT